MPLQRSTVYFRFSLAGLFLLAGCSAPEVVQQIVPPPNPFAYQKLSSLCEVSPLETAPDGKMSVAMRASSDDGHCAVSVSKGGGGSYVSFGVEPAPEHGKAFLYNYNGRTYVNYTPISTYKGEDKFGVLLIPDKGQQRRWLFVNVKVDPVVTEAPADMAEVKTGNVAKKAGSKKKAAPRRMMHHTGQKPA